MAEQAEWSVWRQGIQWYRLDDFDHKEAPEAPYHNDHLRGLVDSLPESQCHLVSRVFFGGATLGEASAEIGIDDRETARTMVKQALRVLKAQLEDT